MTMYYEITDNKLLKKKNAQIWNKFKYLLNIKFDSEPVYGDNDKYIKTKIKIYDGNVIFKAKEVPKENALYKCLSLIMLSFVVRSKERVLSPNSFGRVQI